MKVLMVCSSGGHLAQLMALRPWWSEHERHWVTFDTPDAVGSVSGESVTWAHHPTTHNAKNLVRNTSFAGRTLAREHPDVVVTSGATASTVTGRVADRLRNLVEQLVRRA